jgi:RAB6A-GEF complex partner protein 1
LFLPHILRAQLLRSADSDAVSFANNYKNLVFFAHALEILLHAAVEDDDTELSTRLLPGVIAFLDHFDEGLDVVVRCARKTEMSHWDALFDVAGSPQGLFEVRFRLHKLVHRPLLKDPLKICLSTDRLSTAAQYLLILHTLQRAEADNVADAVRLLKAALAAKDTQLCREVMRFLRSVDDSGRALKDAMEQTAIDVPRVQVGP